MPAKETKSNQELAAVAVEHFGALLRWDSETATFWLHDCRSMTWEPADRRKFQSAVARVCMKSDPHNRLTMGKVDDVIKMMYGAAEVREGCVVEEMTETHLSFSDRQLDLRSLETCGYGVSNVALTSFAFPYSSVGGEGAAFGKYLSETCMTAEGKDNEKMRRQLQEVAGFVLSSPISDRKEKAVLLWGGGANGKSPFLDILSALVGRRRTTAVPLSKMTTDDTTLIGLIGKKLNANSEEESDKVSLARLKQIVSGELISARRIYDLPMDFRVRCRCVFSTNNPPKFEGLDGGVRRRFLVIPFERTVEESRQDNRLAERIIADELPAVVGWALDGLRRLRSNNWVFTASEQSDAALDEMENANNSALDYLRQTWEPSDWKAELGPLYKLYADWCDQTRRKPMAENRFGRECARMFGPACFGKNAENKSVRMYRAALVGSKPRPEKSECPDCIMRKCDIH